MVKMRNNVNIDDFLILMYWIKTIYQFENKKFNYESLLMQVETYKYMNTPLNTEIHKIDDVMIDAYQIYHKLKMTEIEIATVLDNLDVIPNIAGIDKEFLKNSKETMLNEAKKYENIFEDLMENIKYEDPEIRGIQKGFLSEKMKEYVAAEDYERAAKVRDIIKEC